MKNSIYLRKVLLRPWLSKCLVSFNLSQIEKMKPILVNHYHLFRWNIPDGLNPYCESGQKAE